MNATPPDIEMLLRERLMARSNEERFLMGSRGLILEEKHFTAPAFSVIFQKLVE